MNAMEIVLHALKKEGAETPMTPYYNNKLNRREAVEENIKNILTVLGLDLSDDSLRDTPRRVAKMFVDEIFSGLNYETFPKITTIENKMKVDCMVIEKNITMNSTCEHHLITISGCCHIAYIPKEKLIGLSKMNRLVQFFAQRPQVQERLTKQILVAMKTLLKTDDVIVMIDAKHHCVVSRGIKDSASSTITTAVSGRFFENESARSEFMDSIR